MFRNISSNGTQNNIDITNNINLITDYINTLTNNETIMQLIEGNDVYIDKIKLKNLYVGDIEIETNNISNQISDIFIKSNNINLQGNIIINSLINDDINYLDITVKIFKLNNPIININYDNYNTNFLSTGIIFKWYDINDMNKFNPFYGFMGYVPQDNKFRLIDKIINNNNDNYNYNNNDKLGILEIARLIIPNICDIYNNIFIYKNTNFLNNNILINDKFISNIDTIFNNNITLKIVLILDINLLLFNGL